MRGFRQFLNLFLAFCLVIQVPVHGQWGIKLAVAGPTDGTPEKPAEPIVDPAEEPNAVLKAIYQRMAIEQAEDEMMPPEEAMAQLVERSKERVEEVNAEIEELDKILRGLQVGVHSLDPFGSLSTRTVRKRRLPVQRHNLNIVLGEYNDNRGHLTAEQLEKYLNWIFTFETDDAGEIIAKLNQDEFGSATNPHGDQLARSAHYMEFRKLSTPALAELVQEVATRLGIRVDEALLFMETRYNVFRDKWSTFKRVDKQLTHVHKNVLESEDVIRSRDFAKSTDPNFSTGNLMLEKPLEFKKDGSPTFSLFEAGQVFEERNIPVKAVLFYGDYLVFVEPNRFVEEQGVQYISFIDLKKYEATMGRYGAPTFKLPIKTDKEITDVHIKKGTLFFDDQAVRPKDFVPYSDTFELYFNIAVNSLDPALAEPTAKKAAAFVEYTAQARRFFFENQAEDVDRLQEARELYTRESDKIIKAMEKRREIDKPSPLTYHAAGYDESRMSPNFLQEEAFERALKSAGDKVVRTRSLFNRARLFMSSFGLPRPDGLPHIRQGLATIAAAFTQKKKADLRPWAYLKEGVKKIVNHPYAKWGLTVSTAAIVGATYPEATVDFLHTITNGISGLVYGTFGKIGEFGSVFWETAKQTFKGLNPFFGIPYVLENAYYLSVGFLGVFGQFVLLPAFASIWAVNFFKMAKDIHDMRPGEKATGNLFKRIYTRTRRFVRNFNAKTFIIQQRRARAENIQQLADAMKAKNEEGVEPPPELTKAEVEELDRRVAEHIKILDAEKAERKKSNWWNRGKRAVQTTIGPVFGWNKNEPNEENLKAEPGTTADGEEITESNVAEAAYEDSAIEAFENEGGSLASDGTQVAEEISEIDREAMARIEQLEERKRQLADSQWWVKGARAVKNTAKNSWAWIRKGINKDAEIARSGYGNADYQAKAKIPNLRRALTHFMMSWPSLTVSQKVLSKYLWNSWFLFRSMFWHPVVTTISILRPRFAFTVAEGFQHEGSLHVNLPTRWNGAKRWIWQELLLKVFKTDQLEELRAWEKKMLPVEQELHKAAIKEAFRATARFVKTSDDVKRIFQHGNIDNWAAGAIKKLDKRQQVFFRNYLIGIHERAIEAFLEDYFKNNVGPAIDAAGSGGEESAIKNSNGTEDAKELLALLDRVKSTGDVKAMEALKNRTRGLMDNLSCDEDCAQRYVTKAANDIGAYENSKKLASDGGMTAVKRMLTTFLVHKPVAKLNRANNRQIDRVFTVNEMLSDPQNVARGVRYVASGWKVSYPVGLAAMILLLAGVDDGMLELVHPGEMFGDQSYMYLSRYVVLGFALGAFLNVVGGADLWMKVQMDEMHKGKFNERLEEKDQAKGLLRLWMERSFVNNENTLWQAHKHYINRIVVPNLKAALFNYGLAYFATIGRFDLGGYLTGYMMAFLLPNFAFDLKMDQGFELASGSMLASKFPPELLASPRAQEYINKEIAKYRDMYNLGNKVYELGAGQYLENLHFIGTEQQGLRALERTIFGGWSVGELAHEALEKASIPLSAIPGAADVLSACDYLLTNNMDPRMFQNTTVPPWIDTTPAASGN